MDNQHAIIKGYSEFSLSRAGVRSDLVGPSMGAYFKIDHDVSELLPYINATYPDAKFYEQPEHVQFTLGGIRCTLYPKDVIAAPFSDEDQALQFVKNLIDVLNGLYLNKNSLKPDYKKFSPVSVLDLYKLVPQTNCKECEYMTCMAFSAALSKGETTPDQCPHLMDPISEVAIYPVFDKQGNLEATISIEIDAIKLQLNLKKKRPLKNVQFYPRSRRAKIFTTGIH
ncbi:MAG: hypothetical protein JSV38_06050 [Desulfobacterales bacterium]|nr:MAG: hypothetical protein JSV38_06050 [Desulfobacterales bacterium]